MTTAERRAVQNDMISLKDYFESLLDSQRIYFEARLTALDEATRVKADGLEKRFESVNEFRATLSDQASRFTTRDELYAKIEAVKADIVTLKESKAQLEGKASQMSVNVAYFLSFVSIGLVVLKFFVQ